MGAPPACGGGSRERGFGTLKYERLFLDEIPDAVTLAERAEDTNRDGIGARQPGVICANQA